MTENKMKCPKGHEGDEGGETMKILKVELKCEMITPDFAKINIEDFYKGANYEEFVQIDFEENGHGKFIRINPKKYDDYINAALKMIIKHETNNKEVK